MSDLVLKIKGFFTPRTKQEDDFLDFINGSSREKVKVIRQVMREANAEQRKVIEKYKEMTNVK